MRGKWAAGIEPRNFTWVYQGRLAVAERPGGATRVHRSVRREEELRWLKNQKFTRVLSTMTLNANQRAYEEHGFSVGTYPLSGDARDTEVMNQLFVDLTKSLEGGEIILLHADDVSDRLLGTLAGYLLWTGRVTSEAIALASIERLFRRSISIAGRDILKSLPERS